MHVHVYVYVCVCTFASKRKIERDRDRDGERETVGGSGRERKNRMLEISLTSQLSSIVQPVLLSMKTIALLDAVASGIPRYYVKL